MQHALQHTANIWSLRSLSIAWIQKRVSGEVGGCELHLLLLAEMLVLPAQQQLQQRRRCKPPLQHMQHALQHTANICSLRSLISIAWIQKRVGGEVGGCAL